MRDDEVPEGRGYPWVYYGGKDDEELAAPLGDRWTPERATEWYDRQPWIVGVNYFPATAVNSVEMWQAETFDPETLRREFGWARDLGINSVRVFHNYVVWEADAEGLKDRFDTFLGIASEFGISTVPVLFDDCNFSGREAKAGPQPEMIPGVFASQWVASLPPGGSRERTPLWDETAKPYVTDLVSTFAADDRILFWDLYNEPADASLPLVRATFEWARAASPVQPLSTVQIGERFSDLINLHNYGPLEHDGSVTMADGTRIDWVAIAPKIPIARATGRPVIVTEWLARHQASRVETHLPFFFDEKIATWAWGFVAGKMQTYLPYPFLTSRPPRPAPAPASWFHDILHGDGTPYSELEAETFRYYRALADESGD